jgi:hypothetical protein
MMAHFVSTKHTAESEYELLLQRSHPRRSFVPTEIDGLVCVKISFFLRHIRTLLMVIYIVDPINFNAPRLFLEYFMQQNGVGKKSIHRCKRTPLMVQFKLHRKRLELSIKT